LDFEIDKEIIMRGGGYGKVKYLYFFWMIRTLLYGFKLKKGDFVWALGFETAFPLIVASKLKGFRVVYDDADRFSLIYRFPKPIKRIVEQLEKFTSQNCHKHVIPGPERYDFKSDNFYIIKNTPSNYELEKARRIFNNREWPKANLIININGWLGKDRGIDIMLEVSKRVVRYNIHFLLAGRLASKEAEELSRQPNVTYLGNVSNALALASYYASDFVLTYFEPSLRINRVAESNKWGDAIKIGIGIIVNSEVETARYLREGNATISFGYHDIEALTARLIELESRKATVSAFKCNAEALASKFGFFEEQLKEFFNIVFSNTDHNCPK